jgi:hypothetical protein
MRTAIKGVKPANEMEGWNCSSYRRLACCLALGTVPSLTVGASMRIPRSASLGGSELPGHPGAKIVAAAMNSAKYERTREVFS